MQQWEAQGMSHKSRGRGVSLSTSGNKSVSSSDQLPRRLRIARTRRIMPNVDSSVQQMAQPLYSAEHMIGPQVREGVGIGLDNASGSTGEALRGGRRRDGRSAKIVQKPLAMHVEGSG